MAASLIENLLLISRKAYYLNAIQVAFLLLVTQVNKQWLILFIIYTAEHCLCRGGGGGVMGLARGMGGRRKVLISIIYPPVFSLFLSLGDRGNITVMLNEPFNYQYIKI